MSCGSRNKQQLLPWTALSRLAFVLVNRFFTEVFELKCKYIFIWIEGWNDYSGYTKLLSWSSHWRPQEETKQPGSLPKVKLQTSVTEPEWSVNVVEKSDAIRVQNWRQLCPPSLRTVISFISCCVRKKQNLKRRPLHCLKCRGCWKQR
jgi:hypothetical protein